MSSNLSKSTNMVRKVVIGFLIFSIVVLLLQFIMNSLTGEDPITGPSVFSKSAYENENTVFNKLPKPEIDSLTLAPNTRAIFSLGNNESLPEFPPVYNVYEIKTLREKLGDADKARATAAKLGFSFEENRLIDDTLFWEVPGLTRSLTYQKVLHEWKFDVELTKDPSTSAFVELENSTEEYLELNHSLLSTIGIDIDEYQNGNTKVDFINIDLAGNYSTAEVKDDARYVRVVLYKNMRAASLKENYKPKSTDEIVYSDIDADVRKLDYLSGPANLIVQGEVKETSTDIVKFDMKDYQYGQYGVYPAITAEQAWDNIQANQGYLIWLRPQDQDQFTPYEQVSVSEFIADVDRTQIIYIDPDERTATDEWTHFLHPFYLFEGVANLTDGRRAEFAFIIEAVSPNQYEVAN